MNTISPTTALTLEQMRFDNRFVAQLPADPVIDNYRRQVFNACYSRVLPTPVKAPELVAFSREMAALLDLDPAECRTDRFARVFVGNELLPGMDPYACCYGGHQFGHWAGQLGDGLIDAFSFCAGLPIAAYSEIEAQQNINFYAFTPEEQEILVENFPVSAFEIPAGTYATQTEPMHSVAMWNFGIAHKDLPQSFVYEVMKVVLDNHDRMMQIHQAAEETLPENWVHNTFLPFHAGAVQYYKEKGFDIPAELIPEEYQD
jgi:hypothetical protein